MYDIRFSRTLIVVFVHDEGPVGTLSVVKMLVKPIDWGYFYQSTQDTDKVYLLRTQMITASFTTLHAANVWLGHGNVIT